MQCNTRNVSYYLLLSTDLWWWCISAHVGVQKEAQINNQIILIVSNLQIM